MTPAEKILWQELRANKLGVHFRRQQVIAGFIVDFYCHKAALAKLKKAESITGDKEFKSLEGEIKISWI